MFTGLRETLSRAQFSRYVVFYTSDIKLVGLQNCYFGFLNFENVQNTSKKSTFFVVFFKKITPQDQNKKRIYITQHCLMNMCSKFQVDIFNDLDLY